MGKGTYYGKSCTRGTAACRYRTFKIDGFRQKRIGQVCVENLIIPSGDIRLLGGTAFLYKQVFNA